MKIDVLQLLNGKKPESARKAKPGPGFESVLRAEGPGAPPSTREEKKPRPSPSTGTEEALLVSRHLAPALPLLVTKQPELKAPAAKTLAAPVQKAITLEQLVTRAKSQHEPARLAAPTEKKPAPRGEISREVTREVTREAKKADEPGPPVLATAPPSVAAEPFRIEAPPALKDAAPLAPVAPLMVDDPTLRIVLLPTVARMSLDTGDNGRLNLQLKVKDGITEVQATGPAAQLFEGRQGELRVALAKEGLALGHFDLTQSGSQQRHAERPDFERAAPPAARRAVSSQETATEDGRVHVKA